MSLTEGKELAERSIQLSLAGKVATQIFRDKDEHRGARFADLFVHEAGHAVVAISQGVIPWRIVIGEGGGYVDCKVGSTDLQAPADLTSDETSMKNQIDLLTVSGASPDLSRLANEVEEILAARWKQVMAIANHLASRGIGGGWHIINRSEIKSLCMTSSEFEALYEI
jgi:hypothetical protein